MAVKVFSHKIKSYNGCKGMAGSLTTKKLSMQIYFCGKTIKINNYPKNIKIFRLYSMQYHTYTGQTHHYITYGECDQEMCREET